MTHWEIILWSLLAAMALVCSALSSGAETGIYTLNRLRLHTLAQSNSSAATLERLLKTPARLLGTLLIGRNIAGYLMALSIGVLLKAAGYQGWAQVAVSIAIVMPLELLFGEILPKDIFRAHSHRLTVPLSGLLADLQRLFTWTGLLGLIDLLARWMRRSASEGQEEAMEFLHPRRVVIQLLKEGLGQRLISPYQSEMMDRILQMEDLEVADVMVPWARVTALRQDQSPEAAWEAVQKTPFQRFPLLDSQGRPVGILQVRDLLCLDPDHPRPLGELAQKLLCLEPTCLLRQALKQFQEQTSGMAVVMDGETPLGVVTSKNLVEPIVGQLSAW